MFERCFLQLAHLSLQPLVQRPRLSQLLGPLFELLAQAPRLVVGVAHQLLKLMMPLLQLIQLVVELLQCGMLNRHLADRAAPEAERDSRPRPSR